MHEACSGGDDLQVVVDVGGKLIGALAKTEVAPNVRFPRACLSSSDPLRCGHQGTHKASLYKFVDWECVNKVCSYLNNAAMMYTEI